MGNKNRMQMHRIKIYDEFGDLTAEIKEKKKSKAKSLFNKIFDTKC